MHIHIDEIRKISKLLLLELNYFHRRDVAHRDLKPDNFLITDDGLIKICDFRSSKVIISKNHMNIQNKYEELCPYAVSRYYRALEFNFWRV